MRVLVLGLLVAVVECGPATENYKDQYCTDPRTMRKQEVNTEWADAYSCTRHRCQPGGRNLAIYTVGCKRVEAPESAIECEEVVEDTNMQFPFCCTRLRCLVVVRGEVWTRVLGQPWETLPAAPWSHMYKMKKPPPGDGSFVPKLPEKGPVFELTESEGEGAREKMPRSSKITTEIPDYNNAPVQRVQPPLPQPDIVIALSTDFDPKPKPLKVMGETRHKRVHKEALRESKTYYEDREGREHVDTDIGDSDDIVLTTEKHDQPASEEKEYGFPITEKPQNLPWTEIPQNQWSEYDPDLETDSNKVNSYKQQDLEHKTSAEKPSNLQALVDAIGSRMRDIETVVQKMSDKVHTPGEEQDIGDVAEDETTHKRHKPSNDGKDYENPKRPGPDQDHYKRFSVRNRGSKYLHTSESTTENPLFVEETKLNGYFSDASNSVLRRSHLPKEPVQTYMAPVETRRHAAVAGGASDEKKRKKHQHKKKKGQKKGHHKKHHSKKRFNRVTSVEVDKNVISLEDSSAA